MNSFPLMVAALPGLTDATLVTAATRSGAIGLLDATNADSAATLEAALACLKDCPPERCAVRLDPHDPALAADGIVHLALAPRVRWVVLSGAPPETLQPLLASLRDRHITTLIEILSVEEALAAAAAGADGVIAKGHEAGGWVSDETLLVLLPHVRRAVSLPVWAHGGMGRHTLAAAVVGGAAGALLDAPLALLDESALPPPMRAAFARMDGTETVCLGGELNAPFRAWDHPQSDAVRELRELAANLAAGPEPRALARIAWRNAVSRRIGWNDVRASLCPVGQDASFARPIAATYGTLARALCGLRAGLTLQLQAAHHASLLAPNAPWATAHRTRFPIAQGPMTRVSDTPAFAAAVATAGALPFLALGMMRDTEIDPILADTRRQLGDRAWGVGLLGFLEEPLRIEQFDVLRRHRPPFALIAGGQPEHAHILEQDGIPTYLHVPSPGLLRLFVEEGARRFVFEGRECGGHVGPLTSFVLWEQMVEALLETIPPDDLHACHVLLAGGIHDATSAAMAAACVATLAERGVNVGVLMGTAYLFTRDAVACGAILESFQRQAVDCRHTVLLETGPGHVVRCAPTTFANTFAAQRAHLRGQGASPEQVRVALENLNIGRLRLAAKGLARRTDNAKTLSAMGEAEQTAGGLYMLGQVAAARTEIGTIEDLHLAVSVGGTALLRQAAHANGDDANHNNSDQVAIVGMSCLLPGAANLDQFWANILGKTDALREVPASRWDWSLYFDSQREAPDRIYARWGGFLDPVLFDPTQFGMPPASLASIEPIQLLALETARAALCDAGYDTRPFPRASTSVIIGVSGGLAELGQDYVVRSALSARPAAAEPAALPPGLPAWTEDSFAGILLNVIAGRIANRFDLGGPSFTVDAACASSLTAVYLACRELTQRTSDMVLVGGADTFQSPFNYLCFSKTQALSPRGRCRAFDQSADGTAISEGLAMLVLKRLSDAERDGDRIYAVIKGAAGSSDGRAMGLTAPSPAGQARALQQAYTRACVSPASIGLIEAHGTGTVAGDRSEIESLRRVLESAGAAPQSVALGSVKSMIGHTKGAAGVTGLIKLALALRHRVLPPTLGVEQPNASLAGGALYVNAESRPWLTRSGEPPRRAAVNAFGFGGANYHVIVEEYAPGQNAAAPAHRWPCELFLWRGTDAADIARQLKHLLAALRAGAQPALKDLACTLGRHAAHSDTTVTLAVVAASCDALAAALVTASLHLAENAASALWDPVAGIYYTPQPLARDGSVAFLFPGQGSQYPDMLRELAVYFHEVHDAFALADRVLAGRFPRPLSASIFPPPRFDADAERDARQALAATNLAQPAIGAAAIGLLDLLRHLGVAPSLVAGHSYGEYAALCAAATLTAEQLLDLSEARGRFIIEAADGSDLGTMAAVEADEAQTRALVGNLPGLWIANLNAPRQTIISGTTAAVEDAMRRLDAQAVVTHPVPVACAFHSPLVAPAKQRLQAMLASLELAPPRIRVFANTTGGEYPADPAARRALLDEHLVQPVRFIDEINALYAAGARVFIEVGPRNVLSGLTEKILDGRPAAVVPLETRHRTGLGPFLHALAQLAAHGLPVTIERLFAGRDAHALTLDRLAEDTRPPAPSPAAWWVDGGRAVPVAAGRPTTAARPVLTAFASPATFDPATASHPPANATPASAASAPAHPRAPSAIDDLLRAHEQVMAALLDSHKRVMLAALGRPGLATLPTPVTTLPVSAPAPATTLPAPLPQAPVTPPGNTAPDAPSIESVLLAIVAERTGYPHEMLNLDIDLEADLGIDSIKRVEIIGRLRRHFPHLRRDAAQGKGDSLTTQRTLRKIAAWAAQQQPAPTLADLPPPPPIAPIPPLAPIAGAAPAIALDAEHIRPEVLRIVGERTGYPPDMLDLDIDLETALGIDSIKRVEIVGRLRKRFPHLGAKPANSSAGGLSGLRTLRAIIDRIAAVPATHTAGTAAMAPAPGPATPDTAAANSSSAPDDAATPPAAVEVPRFVMRTVEAPPVPATRTLPPNALFVITDDGLGLAEALARELHRNGCRAVLLAPPPSKPDTRRYVANFTEVAPLRDAIAAIRRCEGPIAGLIHLLPLSQRPAFADLDVPAWRRTLHEDVKSLFFLAQAAAEDWRDLPADGLAWIIAAVPAHGQPSPARGGIQGLINTFAAEWPHVSARVLAVGADAVSHLVPHLVSELRRPDGERYVDLSTGARRVVRVVPAPLAPNDSPITPIGNDTVILITGGARGITAEIARELAQRYQPTLVILGRSPWPDDSAPPAVRDADTPEQLRRALAEHLGRSGRKASLAEIEAAYRRTLHDRDMIATAEALRRAGARFHYRRADARDTTAFHAAIDAIHREFGRIDGVIHGAGIIEDKLIADKTPDSFDRVFDTKADSAFVLARHPCLAHTRFIVFFSSTAFLGAPGQADYAAANGILNAVAEDLNAHRPGRTIAMLWGPWEGGMATPGVLQQLRTRGLQIIPPDAGRRCLVDELHDGSKDTAVVLIGDAPYTQLAPPDAGPLVRLGRPTVHPDGSVDLTLTLDPARDAYLRDHQLDGKPVFPSAMAMELMAETALLPGLPGAGPLEIAGLKVLRGIVLNGPCELQVSARPLPVIPDGTGTRLSIQIGTSTAPNRANYLAAVARSAAAIPPPAPPQFPGLQPFPMSVAEAYARWLFQGPAFEGITAVEGIGDGVIVGLLHSTHPSACLPADPTQRWRIDPTVIDASLQLVILLERHLCDMTPLPMQVDRFRLFAPLCDGPVRAIVRARITDGGEALEADIHYSDLQGRTLATLDGLQCTCTRALNRLASHAKP